MKNIKGKLTLVALTIGMLFAYTHCGVPGSGDGIKSSLKFGHNQAPNAGSGVSERHGGSTGNMAVFSTTIWNVTKNNCASCHAGIQQPFHASSDLATAFESSITNQKVDLASTERSRLYLKLKDERHNCWSNCDDNAAEMLAAINSYVSQSGEVSGGGDSAPQGLETSTRGPLSLLSNQGNQLLFTADQFMLQTPFVQKLDGSEYYFENQNNNGQLLRNNANNAGRAFKNFSVPNSGDYNVWALVRAPGNSDDSFHVKIDDSIYYEWHIVQTSGFEWRKLTNTSARNAVKVPIVISGTNQLEVRQREDGTALKKVFLTEDDEFDPATGSFNSFVELSYDISSLVGQGNGSITFKVNLRTFDDYSYEVSNLRVQSNVSLRMKAPKILVNGRYSSQHNTYNYIDLTVNPGETTIADYSMLVLKENGDDSDLFSWSFDELELR